MGLGSALIVDGIIEPMELHTQDQGRLPRAIAPSKGHRSLELASNDGRNGGKLERNLLFLGKQECK